MRSELIDSAYRPTLVNGETISEPDQTIRVGVHGIHHLMGAAFK
jgi:hypothetical protein